MFSVVLSFFSFIAAVLALFNALKSRQNYKKNLDALTEQLRMAEAILKKRGDLAREVAHQIKNPITAILCSAEGLDILVGDKLEDVHKKSLLYIKEYGEYVLHLISDFLDLSMLESKVKEAHVQEVLIVPLIESVLGLLESYAMRRHVQVECQASSPGLAACIDPRHARQIFFNLIHNAIKFSADGADVRVICQELSSNAQIKISIQDNGMGLDAETIAEIFNPYSKHLDKEERGHGLEMPLVKSLVDLAGGNISISSALGIGTCVDVYLPSVSGAFEGVNKDLSSEKAEDIKPLLGYSFLLVDEDEGARETTSNLIEAWGGMVDKMSQAVDALQLLSERTYDVLVLDNGVSEEMLRALEPESPTQIILTSRDPIKAELLDALQEKKVLEKPFTGPKLLSSLLESIQETLKQ